MDRIKQGEKLMTEIFGQDFVGKLDVQIGGTYAPFLTFLKSTFAEIYSEEALDIKTKEIIVLSTLITQKDTKPQLKLHIQAAVKAGVSPKEILALILHLVLYVGFPTAINALNTAKETFDEMGVKY
jgi:4-carboxymuconolactone decarboxylase